MLQPRYLGNLDEQGERHHRDLLDIPDLHGLQALELNGVNPKSWHGFGNLVNRCGHKVRAEPRKQIFHQRLSEHRVHRYRKNKLKLHVLQGLRAYRYVRR